MSEVTQWFPHSVKPVHAGVYHLRKHDGGYIPAPYYFWDGEKWTAECASSLTDNCFDDPCMERSLFVYINCCEWRGLANNPKVK